MTIPVIKHPPRRVVSLVPSLTESLFDLGLGDRLVGITDYCSQPAGQVNGLPRVGGPVDARLEAIIALQPDLVLAGVEENPPALLAALERAGLAVWAVFPKTLQDTLDVLNDIAWVFKSDAAMRTVKTMEKVLDGTVNDRLGVPQWSYFCPIWTEAEPQAGRWWMTFNQDTYSADLLAALGGIDCFAQRQRREPLLTDLSRQAPVDSGGADERYPRVSAEEVNALAPQVILLPDEPFKFGAGCLDLVRATFANTPAVKNNALYCVDGSLITWYGTRMAKALTQLVDVSNGRSSRF
jgi:ABC-type hemin transport system substrate-binding protein